MKFSPTIVFLEVLELVLVDDDDGGALLPEGAGLVLAEAGHGGGLLVFMGVECFFCVFLRGDLVFSSSSCFFLSLRVMVLSLCGAGHGVLCVLMVSGELWAWW